MADDKAFTAEADETRDTDEIVEHAIRMAIERLADAGAGGWLRDADGNPMAIVTGAASDKVPTVQFGNIVIGPVMIQRPIPTGSLQDIIDGARETQKAAEFVVGVERRLLQWALDPAAKVRSPVDAAEAFSAPPAGYNAQMAPVDPRAAIEAAEAASAAAKAAEAAANADGAKSVPATPPPPSATAG